MTRVTHDVNTAPVAVEAARRLGAGYVVANPRTAQQVEVATTGISLGQAQGMRDAFPRHAGPPPRASARVS